MMSKVKVKEMIQRGQRSDGRVEKEIGGAAVRIGVVLEFTRMNQQCGLHM